jgi:hypothetical protein
MSDKDDDHGTAVLLLGMSQAPEKKNEKDGRIFDTK